MELGMRLRQARQEAGLSQRQLCGDQITRNMLSQIENGSARPSMDTLAYLARQLDKPISFFLEEKQPEVSVNAALMAQLRQAQPQQCLVLLQQYQSPDSLCDPERYLIEVHACLRLARTAEEQGKTLYAAKLLEQARQAGEKTPYYTPALERERLLLCHRTKAVAAESLAQALPPLDGELLLRAEAALTREDAARCILLLQAVEKQDPYWRFLMGKALMQQHEYQRASEYLQKAQTHDPRQVYTLLEQCAGAQQDYKAAYFYACKLRELETGNTSFFAPQGV